MKAVSALLPFISYALALSLPAQVPFGLQEQYPGFNIDLNAQRLVQMEGKEPVWMSEWDKIKAKAEGIPFFDITDAQDLDGSAPLRIKDNSPLSVAATPALKSKIASAHEKLSTLEMRKNLEKFSSFRTRYYRSDTGKQSQAWLLATISEITKEYASESLTENIEIAEFPHPWGQNSIIVRINGASEDDGVVVIGAHQDSTNLIPFLPAPGADDDGSGSTTILEAYRSLIATDFQPNISVEFQWYSAEEGGLLGSQAIAKDYAARGVNVVAMVQFDMTAWVKEGTEEVMGVGTDFVDPKLVEYQKKLIETYCDLPWLETQCGYACSDHGSYTKAGYPSSFITEGRFEDMDRHVHSTNDRIDISPEFSFDHMLQFAKLADAFAAETAGWV